MLLGNFRATKKPNPAPIIKADTLVAHRLF